MGIIAGFMVPHPPMIVPDIGRGSEAQVEETTKAYERVADEIASLSPETIVITSPHSTMYWYNCYACKDRYYSQLLLQHIHCYCKCEDPQDSG